MRLGSGVEKNVYADDTLLTFETENQETLLIESENTSKKLKKKLKKKKLFIEDTKTEALILSNSTKDINVKIKIDNTLVETKNIMKYLGFFLTKNLNFSKHLELTCDKLKKTANHCNQILPNNFGPTFFRRKIIFHSLLSILFYGVTLWITATCWKKTLNLIESTIRPLKRTLISGYKSVSNFAQDIISGVPLLNC